MNIESIYLQLSTRDIYLVFSNIHELIPDEIYVSLGTNIGLSMNGIPFTDVVFVVVNLLLANCGFRLKNTVP